MRKLIPIILVLLLVPAIGLADTNVTTNIYSTETVNSETNIYGNGTTNLAINGADYHDNKGVTEGDFWMISENYYKPWELGEDEFDLLQYIRDIVRKIVMPDIRQLQYQNQAYKIMLEDVYGDDFNSSYCRAKCEVAHKNRLSYVTCEDLKCTESPENIWYCYKKISNTTTVAPYKFDFNK